MRNSAKHWRPSFIRFTFLLTAIMLGVATENNRAGSAVHPTFDLTAPTSCPFPSDRFTVGDSTQNTNLRVNLPKPDCEIRRSDCEDIDVINTLDGFNMQPRLSIPFDGPIDVSTVSSSTVFLIALGDTLDPDGGGEGHRVGIDQIVWDALTHTLHVQSDELLDQHTSYVLVVTTGVLDEDGSPIVASDLFRRFRRELNFGQSRDPELKAYRRKLLDAMRVVRNSGVTERDVAVVSVLTTQSSSAMLEKIRDQIKAETPASADFNLGPAGSRTIFSLAQVTTMTWNQQRTTSPALTPVAVNPALLRLIPNAIGQIAFGKFSSPDYTVHPGEYIPVVGTRTGVPTVQSSTDVYFNLYLPSGPKPAGGWPVAIIGHGSGSNKNNVGANVAASFASQGIATIAINQMGHGFGSAGTLTISRTGFPSMTFAEGGRGIDQNGDGVVESREGDEAAAPRTLQLNRDGLIRTLADFMQLIRVIEVGMDADGDSTRDIDPTRVYFFGASLGGMYGSILAAVDPQVQATIANVAGGALVENRRLLVGPDAFRSRLAALFDSRQPSLINGPGINRIAGVAIAGPGFFNENMPLRKNVPMEVGYQDGTTGVIQSPVVNTVAGSDALQEWFDRAAWAAQSANPVAFASHLRKTPLTGVPARPILFTFAKGDESCPNPNTTAILRAGDLADRTVFYRHDLAYAELPGMPKDPHLFTVGTGNLALRPIALEAQRQAAVFFASNGTLVIQPEPARYFEIPSPLPLPESLDYIP